jgi:hypothetical protein
MTLKICPTALVPPFHVRSQIKPNRMSTLTITVHEGSIVGILPVCPGELDKSTERVDLIL